MIGRDEVFLFKFVRIGVWSMDIDISEENMVCWLELFKRFLVFVLSYINVNVLVVNVIWNFFKCYFLIIWYFFYVEWFEG